MSLNEWLDSSDLSLDNYSCSLQHGVEEDLAVFVQLKPFSSLDKLVLEFLSNNFSTFS